MDAKQACWYRERIVGKPDEFRWRRVVFHRWGDLVDGEHQETVAIIEDEKMGDVVVRCPTWVSFGDKA